MSFSRAEILLANCLRTPHLFVPLALLLAACSDEPPPADPTAEATVRRALAQLDTPYYASYAVAKYPGGGTDTARMLGGLAVGGRGYRIAMADSAGYTVVQFGDSLASSTGPGRRRSTPYRPGADWSGLMLPIHQTPEGLRELTGWRPTDEPRAYTTEAGTGWWPWSRFATTVVLDGGGGIREVRTKGWRGGITAWRLRGYRAPTDAPRGFRRRVARVRGDGG